MLEIEYFDGMIKDIKVLWNIMDIFYDDFIRIIEKRYIDII